MCSPLFFPSFVFWALLFLSVKTERRNSQWISCFMKICECMEEKTHNWCQFRGRGRQNIAVIHSVWQWLSGQTKCVQSQTHHSTVSPARWWCNKQCGEIWPFAVRRKNVELQSKEQKSVGKQVSSNLVLTGYLGFASAEE